MQTQLDLAIAALKDCPTVDIRGKKYTQVATRVEVFRRHFGCDWRLVTQPLDAPDPYVRVLAEIYDPDDRLVATGLAEENRQAGPINKTSAVENCETSAIGRCLANLGLHGGEYATAEEMSGAVGQQANGKKNEPVVGRLNKVKLKQKMRDFDTELKDITDEDALAGLLHEYNDALAQCKDDLPSWYDTQDGSDALGIADRIAKKRREIKEVQALAPPPADPSPAERYFNQTVANIAECNTAEDLDGLEAACQEHIAGFDDDALARRLKNKFAVRRQELGNLEPALGV